MYAAHWYLEITAYVCSPLISGDHLTQMLAVFQLQFFTWGGHIFHCTFLGFLPLFIVFLESALRLTNENWYHVGWGWLFKDAMSLVPAFNPSVLTCPCNGASIQCGTYTTTNERSNNVWVSIGEIVCAESMDINGRSWLCIFFDAVDGIIWSLVVL